MNTIESFSGKYRFLSNFWPSPVRFEGLDYPSVEHAYQAAKTLDQDHRLLISRAANPRTAKSMGRMVTLRPDWEQVKESIMLDLLRKKFSDPVLSLCLLETGNAELIEGNYWGDTYWGVCRGKGQNRLGMLLMQVRSELAKEAL